MSPMGLGVLPTGVGYFWSMAILWGGVAVLGAIVGVYALLSFRSHRSSAMLSLATGLFLLSVAPAAAWMGLYGITDDIYAASMACTAILAVGFVCLLVAIRARSG